MKSYVERLLESEKKMDLIGLYVKKILEMRKSVGSAERSLRDLQDDALSVSTTQDDEDDELLPILRFDGLSSSSKVKKSDSRNKIVEIREKSVQIQNRISIIEDVEQRLARVERQQVLLEERNSAIIKNAPKVSDEISKRNSKAERLSNRIEELLSKLAPDPTATTITANITGIYIRE